MEFGEQAAVYMFEDMRVGRRVISWMTLLPEILGTHSTIEQEDRGKVRVMAEIWVTWGVQEGYIEKEESNESYTW